MAEALPEETSWPSSRVGEALEVLSREAGMDGTASPGLRTGEVAREAARLGWEAEAVDAAYGEVERLVRACAPALLRLPGERVLAVAGCRRRWVTVVAPSGLRRVPLSRVAQALRSPLEDAAGRGVERLVDKAGVRGARRERARAALLGQRLQRHRLDCGWLLRLPPGASFREQARQAGLYRDFLSFVGAYAVSYSLLLASWWALGAGVLRGRLVWDSLLAWALLLLTLIPFRLVSVWSRARLAVGAGGLLKRRLLAGALRLQPEEVRHQGAGQALGRVIESESVETLALNGGFLAVAGVVETLLSSVALAAGSAGWVHVLLLGGWCAVTIGMGRKLYLDRRRWTDRRLEMTHDLVERLVGHRTRLVQEPREQWHAEEDRLLDLYLQDSKRFDRSKALLIAAVPRGWLLVSLAVLLPGFVNGSASTSLLALGVGGTLAAYRGFLRCAEGFSHLSGAILSWGYAGELFRAAARPEAEGMGDPGIAEGSEVVLEALDLTYRHQDRGRPVLAGCTLRIARGERLLLEGPSGGGKSTLAALLTGLRQPDSGLVLLRGLDWHTVGREAWRRRVVLAPQFHENHVFTETFAFNLLMGRRWPPAEEDLEEAAEVCRELGLGDLLARMPSGLQQIVGETGWQLSHGERSRLYMARALLQGAEVVLLDESFAALDPENLEQALDCALKRAPTLLVIAHP